MYENLKAEMARKNTTIGALCTKSGVSPQKMTRRINGHQSFTIEEALSIKKVLGVDMPLEVLFQKEVI